MRKPPAPTGVYQLAQFVLQLEVPGNIRGASILDRVVMHILDHPQFA
jgi:hypothetical protein